MKKIAIDCRCLQDASRYRGIGTMLRNLLKHLNSKKFHSNDIKELSGSRKNLEELSKNLKFTFNINKGDLSLVVGGPPCQGYSGIGHRSSYKVDKEKIPSNYLYKDMFRVIEHFNPKAFIFENVRGLLSAQTKDGVANSIQEMPSRIFGSGFANNNVRDQINENCKDLNCYKVFDI